MWQVFLAALRCAQRVRTGCYRGTRENALASEFFRWLSLSSKFLVALEPRSELRVQRKAKEGNSRTQGLADTRLAEIGCTGLYVQFPRTCCIGEVVRTFTHIESTILDKLSRKIRISKIPFRQQKTW